MKLITNTHKGFSLIELSIVLVIVGIVVVSTLVIASGQVNNTNIKITRAKLDRIDQALSLYLKLNNSLPCPADGTLALGSANFGKESKTNPTSPLGFSDATCAVVSGSDVTISGTSHMYAGVVPTNSLGLSDDYMFDAWGNRITYAVSKYCIDPQNWGNNYIYKCVNTATGGTVNAATADGGNITIQDLNGTTAINGTNRITDGAYVIISHGKDGVGAYKRAASSTRIPRSASTSYQERANASVDTGGANETLDSIFADGFINDGTAISSGVYTKYFDDIVHWKTAPKFWDDTYSGNSLPYCSVGQILISNGGTSYSCTDAILQGYQSTPVYHGTQPWFIQAAPPSNPSNTGTIYFSDYPGAKEMVMEAQCSASSGGGVNNGADHTAANTAKGYATFQIDLSDGTSLGPYYVCSIWNNVLGGRIDLENDMTMPVPSNGVDIQITAATTNTNGHSNLYMSFIY